MKPSLLIVIIILLSSLTCFSQDNQKQVRAKKAVIFIHFEDVSTSKIVNLQTKYLDETINLREYLYDFYKHPTLCTKSEITGTYIFQVQLSDDKVIGLKNLRALQPCIDFTEREMKRVLLKKNIINPELADSKFRLIMKVKLIE